jgi:hypothetical protein
MRSSSVLVAALLISSPIGLAGAQTRQPVVFSTPPQTMRLNIRSSSGAPRKLDALVTYTLTSAVADDTLSGRLTISFVSISKKNKPPVPLPAEALQGLPQTVTKENVSAAFAKKTACPSLKLVIGPVELDGSPVSIEGLVIMVPEKRDDELSQLLCFWTTQINSNRARKGIIAKINRLLQGEDQAQ